LVEAGFYFSKLVLSLESAGLLFAEFVLIPCGNDDATVGHRLVLFLQKGESHPESSYFLFQLTFGPLRKVIDEIDFPLLEVFELEHDPFPYPLTLLILHESYSSFNLFHGNFRDSVPDI